MNPLLRAHTQAWLDSTGYRMSWLAAPLFLALLIFGSNFWITDSNRFQLLPFPSDYTDEEQAAMEAALKHRDPTMLRALSEAAEDGDSRAMNLLGMVYDPAFAADFPEPQQKNAELATAYYRKAADLGNPRGMTNAGLKLMGRDDLLSCEYFYKAIDVGVSTGTTLYRAGLCHYKARADGPERMAKGFQLLERAVSAGYVDALVTLGSIYAEQNPPDTHRAIDYLQRSIAANAQGSAYANTRLGDIHFFGAYGVQDFAKAHTYYQRAFRQGSDQAANQLAFMYSKAHYGLRIDHAKAYEYAAFAAEKGNQVGHYNVALAYFYGNGTSRNWDKAAAHFLNAISLGHKDGLQIMLEFGPKYPPDFIRILQQKLARAVLYPGPMDGKFNTDTRRAVEELLNKKISF